MNARELFENVLEYHVESQNASGAFLCLTTSMSAGWLDVSAAVEWLHRHVSLLDHFDDVMADVTSPQNRIGQQGQSALRAIKDSRALRKAVGRIYPAIKKNTISKTQFQNDLANLVGSAGHYGHMFFGIPFMSEPLDEALYDLLNDPWFGKIVTPIYAGGRYDEKKWKMAGRKLGAYLAMQLLQVPDAKELTEHMGGDEWFPLFEPIEFFGDESADFLVEARALMLEVKNGLDPEMLDYIHDHGLEETPAPYPRKEMAQAACVALSDTVDIYVQEIPARFRTLVQAQLDALPKNTSIWFHCANALCMFRELEKGSFSSMDAWTKTTPRTCSGRVMVLGAIHQSPLVRTALKEDPDLTLDQIDFIIERGLSQRIENNPAWDAWMEDCLQIKEMPDDLDSDGSTLWYEHLIWILDLCEQAETRRKVHALLLAHFPQAKDKEQLDALAWQAYEADYLAGKDMRMPADSLSEAEVLQFLSALSSDTWRTDLYFCTMHFRLTREFADNINGLFGEEDDADFQNWSGMPSDANKLRDMELLFLDQPLADWAAALDKDEMLERMRQVLDLYKKTKGALFSIIGLPDRLRLWMMQEIKVLMEEGTFVSLPLPEGVDMCPCEPDHSWYEWTTVAYLLPYVFEQAEAADAWMPEEMIGRAFMTLWQLACTHVQTWQTDIPYRMAEAHKETYTTDDFALPNLRWHLEQAAGILSGPVESSREKARQLGHLYEMTAGAAMPFWHRWQAEDVERIWKAQQRMLEIYTRLPSERQTPGLMKQLLEVFVRQLEMLDQSEGVLDEAARRTLEQQAVLGKEPAAINPSQPESLLA